MKVNKRNFLENVTRFLVLGYFRQITKGSLEIILPEKDNLILGDRTSSEKQKLYLHDNSFFPRVAIGSDIAFGETYVEGLWSTNDLVKLLELFIDNEKAFVRNHIWSALFGRLINSIIHQIRKNNFKNSKKNISAHYDLSNDLFESFLDETMSYSCALFEDETDSLKKAQDNKVEKIFKKIALKKGDYLLEIGCGWGYLAVKAAKEIGCKVKGITLSENQRAYANHLAQKEGVSDKVSFEICDYRIVKGQFDKIISIEMLEAVGHDYYHLFFEKVKSLLKPKGKAIIQSITIPDDRYESYRKGCDWIQKYIFPGGSLPALQVISEIITKTSGLSIEAIESIGEHYATTLKLWQECFNENAEKVKSFGFDERFIRMWNYYFCYCAAGFRKKIIDDVQIVLAHNG